LFDTLDDEPYKALMRALDDLYHRYGRYIVSYASAGVRRGWKRFTQHHTWEQVHLFLSYLGA
jgi:hypothetical protein